MRTEEREIQIEILRLMRDGKVWTNGRLKQLIGQEFRLSLSDSSRANFRPNEAKWEQLVNNALSPSRTNSLHAQGAVERVGLGKHRITATGRALMDQQLAMRAAFSDAIKQLPDWNGK